MFNNILVPLDGSFLAECVLPHVLATAKAFESKVMLLQVLGHSQAPGLAQVIDPLEWHVHKSKAEAYLSSIADRLKKVGLVAEWALADGQAADQIIEYAHGHNIDLIALSSHGLSGLSGWNVSSVVQKIALRSYKSILLVRAYQPVTNKLDDLNYQRLFVPMDGSQRAECILPVATNLARYFHSQILLAHVVNVPEMPRREPLADKDADLQAQVVERNRQEATRYFDHLQSKLTSEKYEVQQRLVVGEHTATILHDMIAREMIDLVLLTAHGYAKGKKWPFGGVTTSFFVYGSTPLIIMQDLCREEAEKSPAESVAHESGGH